ncbi:hypothetical protein AB0I81_17335 [Nonomuraea sp. NPDC050404]|uniref:hypothetical protein n=1 Tax=Nonomuraea sp. NPDC050404 TaxID=3155783 RepID=UPI003411B7FD
MEFLIWADTTTAWLVVLDDLSELQDLRGLWPPACPVGTTLVTTRRRDAALAAPRRRLVEVGLLVTRGAYRPVTRLSAQPPCRPVRSRSALCSRTCPQAPCR